jgi:hypothetical protein
MQNMTDRGFARYEGKSGGRRLIEPRTDPEGKPWPLPYFRQVQLGIAEAVRATRCGELGMRPHCSPTRQAKLRRRQLQAEGKLPIGPARKGGNRHERRAEAAGKRVLS